jgi:hypothetical protein
LFDKLQVKSVREMLALAEKRELFVPAERKNVFAAPSSGGNNGKRLLIRKPE